MNSALRRWLHACHLRPLSTLQALARLPGYFRDCRAFRRVAERPDEWKFAASHPCLDEAAAAGGTAAGHYFHQDLFVAQRIFTLRPQRHIDVGSRVDGFVAHVAVFREIEYFDLRPIETRVTNIIFRRGNLLEPASLPARACDSLSCLHVIEHAGLGRYGDRLQPDGWRIALQSLAQMLRRGGILFLSVPIGRQRIEFNAHRVFAPETLLRASTALGLNLERFAWVDDRGAFHPPAAGETEIPETLGALDYGCGIFELRQTR